MIREIAVFIVIDIGSKIGNTYRLSQLFVAFLYVFHDTIDFPRGRGIFCECVQICTALCDGFSGFLLVYFSVVFQVAGVIRQKLGELRLGFVVQ